MQTAAVLVSGLCKRFGQRQALADVSLTVQRGEMIALLGASGSGKSTLLRHLNGLHRADAGSTSRVEVLGQVLQQGGRLAPNARAQRSRIATVFQQFNLVDRLSVMSNVLAGALHRMPTWRGCTGRFDEAERQRAWAALCDVGIETCAWQRASTLSGGQQQRAAIARALVQGAELVLADEPIASLDPASSARVMELLAALNQQRGVTVIVSLHQVDYAMRYCPRTVALRAGRVLYDGPSAALTAERLRQLYGAEASELLAPATTPDPEPEALPLAAALQAA